MPTYTVKRQFKNGKVAKTPVMHITADDETQARKIFGLSGCWSAYDEYTWFLFEVTDDTVSDAWTIEDVEDRL